MSNELDIFNKSTLLKVEERVKEMQENGGIDFPPNYSPSNALKSSWLKLQSIKDKNKTPVLESCTQTSVMESLLDTVIQGLTPAKDQIYYIPYGKSLTAQRSYFGAMAIVKQVDNVKEIRASIIYEGDEIEIEEVNGRTIVYDHKTSWENRHNDITGAYAVIVFGDDRPDRYTIMTKDEIEQSWAQRKGEDKSKAHKHFSGEMCKKTIIHRACKPIINSSDDANLFVGKPKFNREEVHESQVEAEKEENANRETIDIEIDNSNDLTSDEDKAKKENPEQGKLPEF